MSLKSGVICSCILIAFLGTIHLYVRCQNCNRNPSNPDKLRPKRLKLKPIGNYVYPALHGEPEDEITHERNIKLLEEELQRDRPLSINLKDLMLRTFLNRRE